MPEERGSLRKSLSDTPSMGCKGSRVQISALRPVLTVTDRTICVRACVHFWKPHAAMQAMKLSKFKLKELRRPERRASANTQAYKELSSQA
jgi:hypothetical protein